MPNELIETEQTQQTVTYTLSLTVTRPVRADNDKDTAAAAEWMVSAAAKRELEREVLKTLRKLDGDCDVEVMGCQLSDSQAVR